MLFKIYGERNSGTNFLEQLLQENFGNVFVQKMDHEHCYFWKHGLPNISLKQCNDEMIDVFIFRRLEPWLMSMYKNPYHLKPFQNFDQFLLSKQRLDNSETVKRGNTNLAINFDDKGKTIFDIRYYKYTNILDYFKNNNNTIFVSLEFLKSKNNCVLFLDVIKNTFELQPTFEQWKFIDKHTKTNKREKEQQYNIRIADFRDIIDAKKDISIEDDINQLTFKIRKNNILLLYDMDKQIVDQTIIDDKLEKTYSSLTVYNCTNKIRLGKKHDGGYVIVDNVGEYDCYISAGVANEESFSRDFIKRYKMNRFNSYAFDGTITDYPWQYTKQITFIRKNIADISGAKYANLSFLMEKYNNIFLKMDIEGSEYKWLQSLNTSQLNRFKQIAIEFHGIYDDSWGAKLTNKLDCFTTLAQTHYLVHIHGNNYSGVNASGIPSVIEATYVRKDLLVDPQPNKQSLPGPLDMPNLATRNDYVLNFPPFVHK